MRKINTCLFCLLAALWFQQPLHAQNGQELRLRFQRTGTTTESAIEQGAMSGIVYETEGYIAALSEKYEDLLKTCFFTKDKAFEYENEMRFLLYTQDKVSRINFPFDYLKKIIFGKRCETDMKMLVSHINDQVYKSAIELYEINDKFQEVKYARE